jgi:hypothetical protein
MVDTADLQVIYCAVCDDVRIEIANKETIVGVYSSGMVVPMLPWHEIVCLWMTVIWSGEGDLDLEVQVVNPRDVKIGGTAGRAHAIWRGAESTLTFRNILLHIEMEGFHTIQWRVADGGWKSIRQFPIYMISSQTSVP